MAPSKVAKVYQNRLLSALAPADLAMLSPHMETTPFPLRQRLEYANRKIEHIYFMEHGVASVVASARKDTQVEVGHHRV